MTFAANVVRVLIASPSDTKKMRDVVERTLHLWNGERGAASSVILLPRRWEMNMVAEFTGEDGQSVINRQLVEDADVVIGIFHSKLGMATPRYASGTVEELHEAKEAGKRVHVFFSAMSVDRAHIDPEAQASLKAFKDEIEKVSLYGEFDTKKSLAEQVRRAIEADIIALGLPATTIGGVPKRSGVALQAHYAKDREKNNQGRVVSKRQRLTITNTGDTDAVDVTFTLEAPDDGDGSSAPQPLQKPPPFTLAANGGEVVVPLLMYAGVSNSAAITYTWFEDGEPKSSSHSVTFF